MPTQRIALVDLDGTLADYEGAVERDMEPLWGPNEERKIPVKSLQPPHVRARIELIRSKPGWWSSLKPLSLGFDIVALLRKHDFCLKILTQGPRKHPNAWKEKVEWCNIHIPDADVTITRNKHLVYGKILVDDYPPYVIPWLERRPRGLVLMPTQSWNMGFEHPNVLRVNDSNLDEAELAIQRLLAKFE